MTIDKFIVDEVVNEKWVKVNTWGEKGILFLRNGLTENQVCVL